MTRLKTDLSEHEKRVLDVLRKSRKPLPAYGILEKLAKFGVKAPPTVYRALDGLIRHGLVHRIESLNAFIACHGHGDAHAAQFVVCRECGTATEIHDARLGDAIRDLGKTLRFHIEREMLELIGLCERCRLDAAGGRMIYWSAWRRMGLACMLLSAQWALVFAVIGGRA